MMDEFAGVILACEVTSNGVTLYQYNDNHEMVRQWTVPEDHAMDVYKALQSTYWSFEAGKRDEQCLQYFINNGWI